MIESDPKLSFYEMFCDHEKCDKTIYRTGTWEEFLDEAKSRGWTNKRLHGAWHNFCPLHNPGDSPRAPQPTNKTTNEDINPDEIPF